MNDKFFKSFSLAFAAGCLGGLFTALILWGCGVTELTAHFKIQIAPKLTLAWLYPKIIHGGLWGLLFLAPFMKRSYFFRGIILSAIPSCTDLLIVHPAILNNGFLGMKLGEMTPYLILIMNAIWGASTGLWLQYTEK